MLSEIDAEVIEAPNGDEDTLARLAQGVSAIMTCFAHVTPAVIDAAAATLKVVARYGVGVDNIAVDDRHPPRDTGHERPGILRR